MTLGGAAKNKKVVKGLSRTNYPVENGFFTPMMKIRGVTVSELSSFS